MLEPRETASRAGRRMPNERVRLGELLVREKLITAEQLDHALELQQKWGSRLGDVILTMGWVRPQEFYRTLASHFGMEFVDLIKQPVDGSLLDRDRLLSYSEGLYLPWRSQNGALWIATADPTSPAIEEIRKSQPNVRLVCTSKFDIIWELQRVAGSKFSDDAVNHLATFDPKHSARTVVTPPQKVFLALALAAAACLLAAFPFGFVVGVNALINLFLFVSFLFRLTLCWMSCADRIGFSVSDEEVASLTDTELPVYTVLVPMYQEPEVLPILTAALRRMDYPRSKLDIKLILEEGDAQTIEAAKALALDATFEIVRVPPSFPKTKPKACNYALNLARGKYLTIYDAEDKPQADQLKKAVVAFRKLGEGTACVQARLNYFNAEENWLTRMFTLEYSLWFDMFLPALDRLRVPIPLGGTSNHFDLTKLRQVSAWDPFNVTEDADLGLRFAALGYRVGVINSVTFEEANSRLGNWIRQRSRWIKGYIQTWLVNMRDPVGLIRRVGIQGFCSLQLFVGASVFSALVYPFVVLPFLVWIFTRSAALSPFFPAPVLVVSVANLIAGNSILIYVSMLAAAKRHHFSLLPYALTAPAYWLLMSVAGYKGLWQLVTKPFYWEKTTHGISKLTSAEVLRASSQSE
ncbi:MAG TPA: glycosyltransferase family 2 protein [Bryobacteraceae bacterium]|nr:glycosyltransferase family 2 protein [Bryobacteraceae bacterium]